MLPPILHLVQAFSTGEKIVPILIDTPTACEVVEHLSGYVCPDIETLGDTYIPHVFLFDTTDTKFGIDQSHAIVHRAYTESETGGQVVFVVRHIDRATPDAQNALLKLFEENLDGILFLLTATNPDRILTTIRSRIMAFSHDTEFGEIPDDLIRALDRYAIGDTTELLTLLYRAKDASGDVYTRELYTALLGRIGEYIRDGRIIDPTLCMRFARTYTVVASTNVTAKWWMEQLFFGKEFSS